MKSSIVAAAAVALAAGTLGGSAQAATVFTDTFNTYPAQLNWVPPANWTASGGGGGTVDLIGNTTTGPLFDLFPGNGGYVDLDGSSGAETNLSTIMSFAAGSYTLTFDLAGNARNDGSKTTVITLGNFTTQITLAATDPYALHTLNITTTGGNLVFSDLSGGNNNIGNILDNVTVATVAAIPEPGTWAMMLIGFAGLGFAFRQSRRKVSFA
jgi:PEP-CTERM motif